MKTKEVYGNKFQLIPIKTKILDANDDMAEIAFAALEGILIAGDCVAIAESPLAITQGRAVRVADLRIGFLAQLLWRFVAKVPYGIGLRSPSSMQCAIDETGAGRIILAAAVSALGKLIGRKGDFYRIAGMQAALIDAAATSPIPPYDETVIKGPLDPAGAAQIIADKIGCPVAIMDINDIGGCWMIGGSTGISKEFMELVMIDNPQGQGDELTPLCIVRKLK